MATGPMKKDCSKGKQNSIKISGFKCLKVGTFNARGFKNLHKQNALFDIFKKENLDIIAIQESHKFDALEIKKLSLKWGGPIHFSSGSTNSKGLITLLNPKLKDLTFNKIFTSDRTVISTLTLENEIIYIVNVYSPCEISEKIIFLNKLQSDIIACLPDSCDENFICLGDFNIALTDLDIVSGCPHPKNICQHFKMFIDELNLYDAWRSFHKHEPCYTWSRSRPYTARRLDYILVSESLSPHLKSSSISGIGFSDHRLVQARFEFNSFKRGKGLYKLNTSLLRDENYINVIKNVIQNTIIECSGLNSHLRWDMIKTNVREVSQQFSRYKAKNSSDRYTEIKTRLNTLENKICINNDDAILSEIAILKSELEVFEIERAKGAQIRSRARFVEDGERCSKYFLSLEKHNSQQNIITSLKNKVGKIVIDEQELLAEISSKFKDKYNQVNNPYQTIANEMDEYVKNVNLPFLDENDASYCDCPITENEVADALKSMNNGSAPGHDGLPTEFYRTFWPYIKDPLMDCFRFSFDSNSLSSSEKVGVISLAHKGKDLSTDSLDNWRPITLTNVDYKIIAKVLSIRLNKVIDSLIGEQQSGFVKGRQISIVHRKIDDLLQLQRRHGLKGILLALDFKQAFDSIDINCITKSLELFGFGSNFIRWISILNFERVACIKNGGHISGLFNMQNGVRQGCPISPQLFILAVEILAQKIIQDTTIKGLNPHKGTTRMKVCQYADDTTLFLNDINDMKIAFSHLNGFSIFSNLFLNLNKSYALSTNGMDVDTDGCDIIFKNEIKILGIYFSNELSAGELDLNWVKRIESVRKILARWSRRDLSLIGKIHIVKTFGISQFNFLLQSISLPDDVLKQINKLFFSFVWKKHDNKKAVEKVKREVMWEDIENGGLSMVNIFRFQNAVLLNWAEALLKNGSNSVWQQMAIQFFKPVGGCNAFRSNVDPTDFKGIQLISSMFWRKVLLKWLEFSKNETNQNILISDPIFNNRFITYKNNHLFLHSCIKNNVLTISDVVTSGRILTLNEFKEKFGENNRIILEYYIIFNSVSKIINKIHFTHQSEFYFRGEAIGNLGRKYFDKMLKENIAPVSANHWKRKYNLDICNYWDIIKNLRETRLRIICWKIMHNIYPTKIALNKMKISDSQNCEFCDVPDYLEHFFFHCIKVKPLWSEVESQIQVLTNIPLHLDEITVILGFRKEQTNLSVTRVQMNTINHILAIAKVTISKFKYGKSRHLLEIFESECRIRKLL